MFRRGDVVKYYPDRSDKELVKLCYFHSYALEDKDCVYIYPLDRLWLGIYTDLDKIEFHERDF